MIFVIVLNFNQNLNQIVTRSFLLNSRSTSIFIIKIVKISRIINNIFKNID